MKNGLLALLGFVATACNPESKPIQVEAPVITQVPKKPQVYSTENAERKAGLNILKQATQELHTYTQAEQFVNYTGLQSTVYAQKVTDDHSLRISENTIEYSIEDKKEKAWYAKGFTVKYQNPDKIEFNSGNPYHQFEQWQHSLYSIPTACSSGDSFCNQYKQTAEDFKAEAHRIKLLLVAAKPILQEKIDAETEKIKKQLPAYFQEAQKLVAKIPNLGYCAAEWNPSYVEGEYKLETGPAFIEFYHNAMDSCNSGIWKINWPSNKDHLEQYIFIESPMACSTKEKEIKIKIIYRNEDYRSEFESTIDVSQRTDENAAAYDLMLSQAPEAWRTQALKRQRRLPPCDEGP